MSDGMSNDEAAHAPLDRPLETLALPARVASWVARRKVGTVGALVRWHPGELLLTEPNLGPISIAFLREIVRAACGADWEELWREAHAADPDAATARESRVQWDELHLCLPDAVLELCLEEMALPARMVRYARREGLATVRELVRVRSVELRRAKNIGRRSMESTLALLVDHAGSGLLAPAPDEVPSNPWDALRGSLPSWLMGEPLAHLPLSARMRGFADRSGLQTVADLVAIPRATLARARNVGQRSITAMQEQLLAWAATPPPSAAGSSSFWALWLERLGELGELDRTVLTQRSGISGEPRTCAQIARTMGGWRSTVWRREQRALATLACGPWVRESCARLAGALEGGAGWLDELDRAEPWLAPLSEDRREALAYFLEHVASEARRGRLALGALGGRTIVAECSADEVDRSLARARAALGALRCPADAESVRAAIAEAAPAGAPGLAALLARALDGEIERDAHGAMVAFGAR